MPDGTSKSAKKSKEPRVNRQEQTTRSGDVMTHSETEDLEHSNINV